MCERELIEARPAQETNGFDVHTTRDGIRAVRTLISVPTFAANARFLVFLVSLAQVTSLVTGENYLQVVEQKILRFFEESVHCKSIKEDLAEKLEMDQKYSYGFAQGV